MVKEIKNPNHKDLEIDIKQFKYTCDDSIKSVPDPLIKNLRFFYYLVGAPGSGKTTLLLNLICKKGSFYNQLFDQVWLFSPSLSTLEKNPFDALPDNQKFDEITKDNLNIFVDGVSDSGEKVLLILDDVQNDLKADNIRIMKKIIMNRRHLCGKNGSCSIIMTSQLYNAVPLPLRKQIDCLFQYPTSNTKELKSIHEELFAHLDKDKATLLFNFIFDQPHNFLYLKVREKRSKMFYKNFNLLSNI